MQVTPKEVEQRRKTLNHVKGSSALEGVKHSSIMNDLTEKYVNGEITIAEAIKRRRSEYEYEPR